MNSHPENFVSKWAKTVIDGELNEVLDLYSPTASFFPTFLRELGSQKSREEYFRGLKNKNELRVDVDNEKINSITKNIRLSWGIYTFSFKEDDRLVKYPSRYTFIYDTDKRNPILHHHSSVIPGLARE